MTISLSAQRRAAADKTNRQFRIFAGPPERFINTALFVAGEPVTLPLTTRTTELVAFGADPIDIDVVDASGYSNLPNMLCLTSVRGHTWFRYESIDGNTLEGCTRIHGVDSHYTGALVNQWVEVSSDTTELSGQDMWDGAQTVDWTWSLSGLNYNSDFTPPDCTVLITQSLKGVAADGDKWDDYVVMAYGYCRNWDASGDALRRRRWSGTIESLSMYVNTYQVPGRTFGRVNLALGQPVTASDNLANPLDLTGLSLPEWITGIGTTDADKLTDGFVDTGPYVSAVAPSQTPETEAATPHVVIQEVFREGTFWWIKLLLPQASPNYNEQGIDLSNFSICNKQTGYVQSNNWFPIGHPCAQDDPPAPRRHPPEIKAGATDYGRLNGVTLSENQPEAIITSNRNRFLDRYHTDTPLFDIRDLYGFGDDGLSGRNMTLAEDDWVQIRGPVNNGQEPQYVMDMVVFGTHTGMPWWNGAADDCYNGAQWNDSPVANPDAGNSIRRYTVANDFTQSADDWIEEEFPNPADRRTDTDSIYMSIELPDNPAVLSENISDSIALEGEPFPISDPDYLRPVIADRYLVIRVDTEQMLLQQDANGIWFLDTRAYNSTTPAAHTADTPIYYEYEEEFIRLCWVESVELRRWERYDRIENDGDIIVSPRVPGTWEIWGTREASPLYPGDSNYRLDWIGTKALVINQTGNDPSAWNQNETIPIQPLKHVMVVGKRMKTDNTYWMCNEMRVWRAGLSNASSEYGGIGGVVYWYLSQLLDDDRIVIDEDTFTNTSADITIQGGALGQILQDLGKQYGFLIRYTRDNKVHIRRNPFHPRAIRQDFDLRVHPTMIEGTLTPQRANYPSRLGNQYVVNIHNTDALQIYTGVYPPAAPFGDIVELDFTMKAGSETEANQIAQMLYLADGEISRKISLRIVGALPEAEPLQRHLVFDYTDNAADAGRWVDCLVTGMRYEGGYEYVDYQEWRQA